LEIVIIYVVKDASNIWEQVNVVVWIAASDAELATSHYHNYDKPRIFDDMVHTKPESEFVW
jgi:hypothetical protein